MNSKTILKSLLILFPVLAVALATTVDSVTVFDTVTKQTSYYSYFDLIPVQNLQMLTPLAGCLSAASGILAAVYMAKGSEKVLKAVGTAAAAAAVLAALPPVMRNQVMVVPNAALPIFMLLQACVARYFLKKGDRPATKNQGKRLSR